MTLVLVRVIIIVSKSNRINVVCGEEEETSNYIYLELTTLNKTITSSTPESSASCHTLAAGRFLGCLLWRVASRIEPRILAVINIFGPD